MVKNFIGLSLLMNSDFCIIIRTRYLQNDHAAWTSCVDVPNAKKLVRGFRKLACFIIPKSNLTQKHGRCLILWFEDQQSAKDAMPILKMFYEELTSFEADIEGVCLDQTTLLGQC